MLKKKLVIIGDGGAGKTSLLMVYKDNEFPTHYVPTVFETYATQVQWNNKEITLELWDTAGQEDYDRLRPLSYSNADIVIICYNIDSLDSVVNVKEKWAPEVSHFCPNVPIILVGTKMDLRNDLKNKDSVGKFVSKSQGKALAQSIKAAAHFECSAKENKNVQEIFEASTNISMPRISKNQKRCWFL